MKILHVVPTYLPAYRYGGPIYSVHELNKGLVKNGAEVVVYTTNIDGPNDLPVKTEVIDGVEIHYFPSSFPRKWFYSKSLKNALYQNAKDFDLIHITSVFLSASYLGAKCAKKFGKPYIISPRGSLIPELINKKSSFLKRFYIKLIERRNLSGAAAIHFTTRYEEDMYEELGLPLKKSILIPNGVDLPDNTLQVDKKVGENKLREKFGISKDADVILSLGRLNWKKGFDTLIPAFADVKKIDPKAILVIAGDDGDEPGQKDEIRKIIKENNISEDSVKIVGDLRGAEKDAAYGTASVFVMPSYSENFGIAAVESMAHGTAVVVTNTVGIASDIKEYAAGFVVNKKAEELTFKIIEVINNKDFAVKLGINGRKLVSEKYIWEEIAKKWILEYTELIRK